MNADALAVVSDPDHFADQTMLRRIAWVVLMTQRGKRVNQFRLGALQRSLPAVTVLTGLILRPGRMAAPSPTFGAPWVNIAIDLAKA